MINLLKIKYFLGQENTRLFMHVGFVVSLSLYRELVPYFIWGLLLTLLLKPDLRSSFKKAIRNPYLQLFWGFYLLHIIGLFYSTDLQEGFFKVQVKLAFILLPLILFSENELIISHKNKICKAFVIGVFLSLFVSIIVAIYHSFNNPHFDYPSIAYYSSFGHYSFLELLFSGYSYFNYSFFSHFLHPSYLSMYIGFVLIIFVYIITSVSRSKKSTVWGVILIAFSTLFIFLLQSRAGTIAFLIIGIYFLLYFSFRQNQKLIGGLSIAVILVSSLTVLNYSKRFEPLKEGIASMSYETLKEKNVRIWLWELSVDIIKENPVFGVGTGDVTLISKEYYTAELLEKTMGIHLASHNDFLQTTVRLGIVGGLFLILIFLFPLLDKRLNQKNLFLIPFLLLVWISFSFESMLERVNGIYFFVYFYCLIVVATHKKKKTTA